jgi:hypothetical protein
MAGARAEVGASGSAISTARACDTIIGVLEVEQSNSYRDVTGRRTAANTTTATVNCGSLPLSLPYSKQQVCDIRMECLEFL